MRAMWMVFCYLKCGWPPFSQLPVERCPEKNVWLSLCGPAVWVLVPWSRSEGGDCVTHVSQAGLACHDALSSCKETYFWKSVASLPHFKNCPGMPIGQWIPMSTFLSSFWSTELLKDLLPIDKNALLICLISRSSPFHIHGMPRQSHKASGSLLHESISHNTNCAWKTV